MRASQKLSERCEWVRIFNRIEIEIQRHLLDKHGHAFLLEDLLLERAGAVEQLAELGFSARPTPVLVPTHTELKV